MPSYIGTPIPATTTPALADSLQSTLNNLVAQRLAISANPKPSYILHGHAVSWTEYLKYLGDEIDRVRVEIAQVSVIEETGIML